MWQPFLCGDVKGGVYHVPWLQIKRCGELDPEGSPPPGCCRNKWFGVGLSGGLFMPECLGGRYSVVSCNSPFRGGAWCDVLTRVGGKVRQNRWDLSADVPQMVLLVGSLERCFARRACRERDVR
jgi:hypothetical protein